MLSRQNNYPSISALLGHWYSTCTQYCGTTVHSPIIIVVARVTLATLRTASAGNDERRTVGKKTGLVRRRAWAEEGLPHSYRLVNIGPLGRWPCSETSRGGKRLLVWISKKGRRIHRPPKRLRRVLLTGVKCWTWRCVEHPRVVHQKTQKTIGGVLRGGGGGARV